MRGFRLPESVRVILKFCPFHPANSVNPVYRILFFLLLILSASACLAQGAITFHVPPQAIEYQRARRILNLFGMGWNVLGIWLVLRTGLAARWRDFVLRKKEAEEDSETKPVPPFRSLLAYYAIFTAVLLLWNLPIGLAGRQIEARFGFLTETLGGYLTDMGSVYLIELWIPLLLWHGYWLYVRSPRHWWKILWGIAIPLLVFMFVLEPVVIAPAFNRYTPLQESPIRAKILALASQAGVTGANVFVEDTSKRTRHVNAYVTGIGPTTRIVINDTALQSLPEDQLLAMIGHELGHYVEGHIWFGLAGSIVGLGIFLWILSHLLPLLVARKAKIWHLNGVTDLAALPLLLLVITLFLIIQAPIENGISRYMEHRADAFGLRLTHLNDATVRLFIGFAERDYSDPNPPVLLQFWFGSHPTLAQRIAFAKSYDDK